MIEEIKAGRIYKAANPTPTGRYIQRAVQWINSERTLVQYRMMRRSCIVSMGDFLKWAGEEVKDSTGGQS